MRPDFTTKKAAAIATAAALMASMSLLAACSNDKIYSDPNMTTTASQVETTTEDPMSYEALNTKFATFSNEITAYMSGTDGEHHKATVKNVNDKSLAGTPARSVYTATEDGKYRALQQEKTYNDKTVMDEYFEIGDDLMIARTTINKDGSFQPVEKFYISGGIVRKLDSKTKSVMTVAELGKDTTPEAQKKLDLYFTFREIADIYGK